MILYTYYFTVLYYILEIFNFTIIHNSFSLFLKELVNAICALYLHLCQDVI
jgi:hypothetical protein